MTPEEKWESLRAVESASLPVKESLIRLDVSSSTCQRPPALPEVSDFPPQNSHFV
jgi:hypothetical protein